MFVIDASYSYSKVRYFVNIKDSIELKISNTLNNLNKYNASNNKNLEYKIIVKNDGNEPSKDNIITTNVSAKTKPLLLFFLSFDFLFSIIIIKYN